jgi:hypothetical protein
MNRQEFEITIQSYKSEKTRWLEDFFARQKTSDFLNYHFIEGLHCGKICRYGIIVPRLDEAWLQDDAAYIFFKRTNSNENDLHMYQSALLESFRGINAIVTNHGFHFSPYWYDDLMNECDLDSLYKNAFNAGIGVGVMLKRTFPNMHTIDNNSDQSIKVRCWVDGFLSGLSAKNFAHEINNDINLKYNFLLLASLKDNFYHVFFNDHPQPLNSTLKLIDFYRMAYHVPFLLAEIYSAFQLDGRIKSISSSKRRNDHGTQNRHVKKRSHRRREKRSGKGGRR